MKYTIEEIKLYLSSKMNYSFPLEDESLERAIMDIDNDGRGIHHFLHQYDSQRNSTLKGDSNE